MSALTYDGVNSAGYLIAALRASLGKKTPIIVLGGDFEDIEIVRSQTDADLILKSIQSLGKEISKLEDMMSKR